MKVIQISILAASDTYTPEIFALCDDGRIWRREVIPGSQWEQIGQPPDPEMLSVYREQKREKDGLVKEIKKLHTYLEKHPAGDVRDEKEIREVQELIDDQENDQ